MNLTIPCLFHGNALNPDLRQTEPKLSQISRKSKLGGRNCIGKTEFHKQSIRASQFITVYLYDPINPGIGILRNPGIDDSIADCDLYPLLWMLLV